MALVNENYIIQHCLPGKWLNKMSLTHQPPSTTIILHLHAQTKVHSQDLQDPGWRL